MNKKIGWKSEVLALVFGMFVILIIFGDAMPNEWVGNLDTIFGQTYWPLMDIIYPNCIDYCISSIR